jgi:hypothetical protein
MPIQSVAQTALTAPSVGNKMLATEHMAIIRAYIFAKPTFFEKARCRRDIR